MKPYAFDPPAACDTGCCPGHDWPKTRRWSGKYRSAGSHRFHRACNVTAKRNRRHRDKYRLRIQFLNDQI